jgi:hypothetical protein
MSDPYAALGAEILAAARRQQTIVSRDSRRRPHLRIVVLAMFVLLACATIALAASGLLSGSAVKPRGELNPSVGEGIPAPGGSRLLSLRVPDPQGGPPWGMRVVHTTRGAVCVQVGRVLGDQLGELGIDGAFRDDGRFHAVAPDVLPTDAPTSANASCVPAGQTFSGSWADLDRNATGSRDNGTPAASGLREVSYGLLGAHALDVTYRAGGKSIVGRLTSSAGAYLIVEPASRPAESGGFSSAFGDANRRRPSPWGAVSAITYRFGGVICSDGSGARVTARCPTSARAPSSTILPTRSLDLPLRVTVGERHEPGYDGELEFTAPYGVNSTHQIYEVLVAAPGGCASGGTSGRALERDIRQGEKVRVHLEFLFQFARRCGPTQRIQVRYINPEGPSAASPHASVILGSTTVTEPAAVRPRPRGTISPGRATPGASSRN